MIYMKSVFVITLFALSLADQPAQAPEVIIEQGTLRGKISTDGSFFEYMGIPYARTNKSNRFKAPLPPPTWEGVYEAIEETYSCPQMTVNEVTGTEDCLKINIYVPAVANKPLSVMVYIHGGAFNMGNGGKGIYGPEFLVKHNLIIVTFNYRLGALGFVCLGIEEAPGNAGLKDQVAALRWVKQNIAAFGGDPDNITLFGESAGGTSTSLLIASDATTGLFNRAIVQSGSALAHWAVNRDPVWTASLLTKTLGYNTEDPQEIYKILSELPYRQLIEINATKPTSMFLDTQLLHIPCIEKSFPGEEAVITDWPINLFLNKPKNIPLIYGTTSKEGIFFADSDNEHTLKQMNDRYLFASDLEFENKEGAAVVNQRIKEFYFGDDYISMENILGVINLYTALNFEVPAILETDLLIPVSNSPVYNYYFDYDGGRNFMKSRTNLSHIRGASHADELFYIFDARVLYSQPIDEKDQLVIDWMTTLWTNFAKYGNPTPPGNMDLPITWEPSNNNEFKFLYIEDELKMGSLPNPKQYEMWKEIYAKYGRTENSAPAKGAVTKMFIYIIFINLTYLII